MFGHMFSHSNESKSNAIDIFISFFNIFNNNSNVSATLTLSRSSSTILKDVPQLRRLHQDVICCPICCKMFDKY